MLYSQKITLFNFIDSSQQYHSEVLNNVEYQQSYANERALGFDESIDHLIVLIKFKVVNDMKQTLDGKNFYLPNEFASLSDKTNAFTFQTQRDFVALGDFSNYAFTDLETFKNAFPNNIFIINLWREYLSVLPHWEITSLRHMGR